jgi:hypothetical protein
MDNKMSQNENQNQSVNENNSSQSIILFEKDGLVFKKIKDKHYNLSFVISNNNIILFKIIDFPLMKLIYELNPDVYEKINLERINEDEANLILVMKHFFEDLGLPQRYIFIHINKIIYENSVLFESVSIKDYRPDIVGDCEQMAIKKMTTICGCSTPHIMNFNIDVIFEDYTKIPPFVEKMIGMIINKIFMRVKLFIEKM